MLNIFSTKSIEPTLYAQLKDLFKISSDFDKTSYILPSFEEMSEYPLFIFITENNRTVGVLWNCDEILNEAFGLILPEYRKKGLFRNLLANLPKDIFEDLTFYGKPEYPLMSQCAKYLGFSNSNTELLMTYQQTIKPSEWEHEVFEDDDTFSYYIGDNFIGSCSIFETESAINIFEVFVEEAYRNKGYGTRIVNDVLWSIQNSQKEIILQVSKENIPAVCCYQKCGFVIKDATVFYKQEK